VPLGSRTFYVPGAYVAQADGHRMSGGLHMELWSDEVTRPHPLVMLHGGGQTGTCFTDKPDGGTGWAQAFARSGFAVHVVDEPARGRSPYSEALDGPRQPVYSAETAERLFTAASHHRLWPGAERHSQWPGPGRRGDPVFDRFYASQTPQTVNGEASETAAATAIVSLLREIGPAILLAHSQGAPRAWRVADTVPDLVKGIVAVEPMGRPFYWTSELAPLFGVQLDAICHPYGVTVGPITYDPPVTDPAVLLDWRNTRGRRRLANLSGIPVTIVSAEASYHRNSDIEISEFLTAMGVSNRLMILEDLGLRGNGHMMMLERNSDDIAEALVQQIRAWELG
jgi:pimeloyl-ACP methyl ester carboxylesterase